MNGNNGDYGKPITYSVGKGIPPRQVIDIPKPQTEPENIPVQPQVNFVEEPTKVVNEPQIQPVEKKRNRSFRRNTRAWNV